MEDKQMRFESRSTQMKAYFKTKENLKLKNSKLIPHHQSDDSDN